MKKDIYTIGWLEFDKNLKDCYQYIPILYKYEFDKLYISTVGWSKTYYAHILTLKFYFKLKTNLLRMCRTNFKILFQTKNEFLNLFRHVFILFQTKNLECSIKTNFISKIAIYIYFLSILILYKSGG